MIGAIARKLFGSANERRIKGGGELDRGLEAADVPADVTRKLLFSDAEIAQSLGDGFAGVVAEQQKRRLALFIEHLKRRRIARNEELLHRAPIVRRLAK